MPSAPPRYGRDRERPMRRGAPGARRGSPWMLAAGALLVLYCFFLLCMQLWSAPGGSVDPAKAPTEQLSNLRKVTQPVVGPDESAETTEEIAARLQVQKEREERARQIPIKVVLPTPTPQKVKATAAPAATIAVAVTDKPVANPTPTQKMDIKEDLENHVPVIPDAAVNLAAPVERRNEPGKLEDQPAAVAQPDAAAAAAALLEAAAMHTTTTSVQTTEAPVAASFVPFSQRHEEISGYDATMKFLESYEAKPDESLFLLFMCSDDHFGAGDWSYDCREGKQHVYDVFAKSPGRNRLVTVLAGSERYWKHQNDFYNDADLRVKGVPSLLRWEGHSGRTSGYLVQKSLYDDPFLRYLFGNEDRPEQMLPADAKSSKQVVTVNGYDNYLKTMEDYKREKDPVPTFLMMVSGRFRTNNRPWCPYCRYSELPLEYAFYSYAPANARLIRVEVTDLYSEWKHHNKFSRDPDLKLKSVPMLFHIQQIPSAAGDAPGAVAKIQFDRHKIRFDELTPLRELFTSYA